MFLYKNRSSVPIKMYEVRVNNRMETVNQFNLLRELLVQSNNNIIKKYFSGNIRRFRRICEHIQSMVCVSRRPAPPPASPRAQRRSGAKPGAGNISESESVGSDTSEKTDRLTPCGGEVNTRQVRLQ